MLDRDDPRSIAEVEDDWHTSEVFRLLRELCALHGQRARLELEIHQNVTALRHHGATWLMIAEQLGVTRQAAQQRFGESLFEEDEPF